MIKWGRWSKGYEISTNGDRRFSALNAKLKDGRSIEQHYQCCVKGYDPGGKNWRLGKGKPPLDTSKDLWTEYLKLWKEWCDDHEDLIIELKEMALLYNSTLTDCFAKTAINQARALATILNERYFNDGSNNTVGIMKKG